MEQAAFSMSMNEKPEQQFGMIYAGIDVSFGGVSNELTRTDGRKAFMELRAQAERNGVQDLTLDKINEEIRQVRYGEK